MNVQNGATPSRIKLSFWLALILTWCKSRCSCCCLSRLSHFYVTDCVQHSKVHDITETCTFLCLHVYVAFRKCYVSKQSFWWLSCNPRPSCSFQRQHQRQSRPFCEDLRYPRLSVSKWTSDLRHCSTHFWPVAPLKLQSLLQYLIVTIHIVHLLWKPQNPKTSTFSNLDTIRSFPKASLYIPLFSFSPTPSLHPLVYPSRAETTLQIKLEAEEEMQK